MRLLVLIASIAALALAGCSSGQKSTEDPDAPAWIRQPTRTVDAGYIVYVGASEDALLDQARFKAEAQAIEDLANECSFAPKGARVEDHYERIGNGANGPVHQAYVKIGVDFLSCEQAKAAVQPDDIHRIANVAMAEEVKRYQTLVDEPEPEPLQAGEEGSAGSSGTQTSNSGQSAPVRTVYVVRDEPGFFILRQQVAYYKQTIILPPPPGTPAPLPAQATATLASPMRQLQGYEQEHPEIKNTPSTWSVARPAQFRPATRMRIASPAMRAAPHASMAKPRANPKPQPQQPRKGKRKRKWPEER
jgi:hypothetical protein